MICEIRTYTLHPRTTPKVEEAYKVSLPDRLKMSPLGGFWKTDIGPLNQVIHFWPYADVAERQRVRADAAKLSSWPPKISEFVATQESKIVNLAPFSPKLEPRKLGEIYEMRMYTFASGDIPKIVESWGNSIAERLKFSPLVLAGFTETGPLNQWIHVWAYKDLNERAKVRHAAAATGLWPPKGPAPVHQQNLIMTPASFSPLS